MVRVRGRRGWATGPIHLAAMALTGLGHAGAGPRGRFTRLMGVVLQLGTAVALGPRKNVLFFLNGKHSSAL